MKPSACTSHSLQHQKGDFLLESLIGLVLIAIVGMGEVYVAARALAAERNMRLEEIATSQMRALLIANKLNSAGICGAANPTITLPAIGTVPLNITGCATTLTVQINNKSVPDVPLPVVLQTNIGALDPAIRVGRTWGQ